MFDRILIANRGEIAARVIRTAKRMGIRTVAVYSEADRNALHVAQADEAVFIGPAPSAQSYLSIDRIVEAARQTGAQAVHPGYGFLSENPRLAQALESAGIAFIGPPVGAIEAMGDKIESKRRAQAAGVSTVPGFLGEVKDAGHAAEIAEGIGFPVMIKASAGGGGKGMRVAWNEEEARDGFRAAQGEARASFGDDRIFIEKFVTEPRHIEIQVLGDRHGSLIHLGERECSIQRRNQKVIEEAPSPFLDAETRAAMGAQAVALAKAVGYFSAGTVEFIVDRDRNFYFLEMNTRLQVEHPVTELVTGLDLVEEMIRVAAGERLRIAQGDVRLDGWAIESRIYAEDPVRNFLPSIGRLTRYRPPAEGKTEGGATVRNDTGVFEGGEISVHYDPMIAKLCTHAPDRTGAVDAMAEALDRFELEGVGNNLAFLSVVMAQERFRAGRLSTAYIAEEFADGFAGVAPSEGEACFLAVAAAQAQSIAAARRGAARNGEWVVRVGAREWTVRFDAEREAAVDGGEPRPSGHDWQPGRQLARFAWGEQAGHVKVAPHGSGWRLRWKGIDVLAAVRTPRVAALARLMPEKTPPDTSKLLLCPMPGVVTAIFTAAGDTVEQGQALAAVEAMKMENTLRAERRGTVKRVAVSPGTNLAVDALILEFE